jgi:hypothetical protein
MRTVTIDLDIGRPVGQFTLWPASVRVPLQTGDASAVANRVPVDDCEGICPGARIATARGYRRIEALESGERVMTRDNGLVPVMAVRRVRVAAGAVVTLAAGLLRGLEAEVALGSGQGILWTGHRVEEALGSREGLLRVCDLVSHAAEVTGFVTLFQPVLARQEIIFCEGVGLASSLPEGGVPARRALSEDEARRVLRG